MRTLQTGDRPTRLAQALAEFGRIEKTLHTLTQMGVSGLGLLSAQLQDVCPYRFFSSRLDQLRSGPVMVSGPALIRALRRLDDVRGIGITLPAAAHIPPSRIAALARFANTAKVTAINRLPASRRMATLVAFALCLEATAHDDALEVLEALLRDLFSNAEKADKKARMRSLKDLDRSAATLAAACKVVLDSSISDDNVRARLFNDLPRTTLEKALEEVNALIRPVDDVYFLALEARYRSVRRFLPDLLKHIRFGFSPAGKGVAASLEWLQLNLPRRKPEDDAPQEIVAKAWQKHITREDGSRAVFHGKRGELRQRYREGQEDQLGALGLVVNIIVLWNTLYMTAAVERLKQHGYPVLEEDLARLSPLIYEHINMLGRYSFAVPEEVARGELRPLRNPDDDL